MGYFTLNSYRIDWLDGVVWDCVYALLKQPEWIEEELSKQEANEHIDELRKRIGIEHQRIDRTQAKIRRIQEGYEVDPQSTPRVKLRNIYKYTVI